MARLFILAQLSAINRGQLIVFEGNVQHLQRVPHFELQKDDIYPEVI